jgi:hypothetical protein
LSHAAFTELADQLKPLLKDLTACEAAGSFYPPDILIELAGQRRSQEIGVEFFPLG